VNSSVVARRRALESVLRRASSSARATNERVGSSSAGRGLGLLRRRRDRADHGAHRGCANGSGSGGGARCSHEEGSVGFYSWAHRGERVPCASRRRESWYGSQHGVRRQGAATCGRRRANGLRRRSRPTIGETAWHRPTGPRASRTGTPALRSVHRTQDGLGVRYNEYDTGRHDAPATSRAGAFQGDNCFNVALLTAFFLKISQQKWTKA
jgi:hypothetical protein